MDDDSLSAADKASLTNLARQLVDRSQRAGASDDVTAAKSAGHDVFSPAGLSHRLVRLEETLDATRRDWAKNLNTVLFAVERLESEIATIRGEMRAFREVSDTADERASGQKRELEASARQFADHLSDEFRAILAKVETLLDPREGRDTPNDRVSQA